MLERFAFSSRVVLLLGLMAVAAGVDLWRNGKSARRHREYGFICIAGILGGLVGFANDCITSSISPDYFIFGKGLEPGNDLRWRAGVYGFQAGLSAAAVGGAVCLFVRARTAGFSMHQMRRLIQALWMPLVGAVLLGLALPVIAGNLDPMGLRTRLDTLINEEQIIRFRKVWWIHTGLYSGLVAGLVAMIVRQRGEKLSPGR
jgi:hypothetical protein